MSDESHERLSPFGLHEGRESGLSPFGLHEAGLTVVRINRRRALRAARRMALAGWCEMSIRLGLGLSKDRCRAAMSGNGADGNGIWSREERREMLMAFAQAGRSPIAETNSARVGRS